MKRHLLIIISMFLMAGVYAQTPAASNPANTSTGPKITFNNITHNFGTVPYMGDGSHLFVITNQGTEPLIITKCVKGCGCTVVNWTKFPILPGKKGLVKATYNTRKPGPFNRGVDVYSNDPNNPKINLRLIGNVDNEPATPHSPTPPTVKTPE